MCHVHCSCKICQLLYFVRYMKAGFYHDHNLLVQTSSEAESLLVAEVEVYQQRLDLVAKQLHDGVVGPIRKRSAF